ncbi:hypothetical protein Pelo_12943 [Pelomyxa schiedti]|nr:hypothetical protein Pelo_12943 [Pelomyxa schiedti]
MQAPEYFTTKMYNTKVDVYSYGMCLWQMWVREEPWSSAVVWDIPNIVSTGARPEVPRDCPIKYSQLMQQCWAQQQDVRPEFDDIIQIISDLLQAEQSYILTSRSESRHSNRTNTPTKHSSTPPQTRSSTNSKNSNTRSIPKHDSDKPVTAVSLTTITTTTSTTPTPPLGSGVGTPRVPLSVHTDSRTSDSAKKLVRQNSKSLGSYLKHSKADGSRFRKLAVALDSSSTVANPSSLHHP